MAKILNYNQLIIWQKGIQLAMLVYRATSEFPKQELFGLVSQMNRASVSIPSNIAEGFGRKSREEFKRFLKISLGSVYELKTQMYLSNKFGYVKEPDFKEINIIADEVAKIIHVLLKRP